MSDFLYVPDDDYYHYDDMWWDFRFAPDFSSVQFQSSLIGTGVNDDKLKTDRLNELNGQTIKISGGKHDLIVIDTDCPGHRDSEIPA